MGNAHAAVALTNPVGVCGPGPAKYSPPPGDQPVHADLDGLTHQRIIKRPAHGCTGTETEHAQAAVDPRMAQFTSPVVAFWVTTSAPRLIKPALKTCPPGTNISAAPPIIAAPPTMYSQLPFPQSPAAARAPRLEAS